MAAIREGVFNGEISGTAANREGCVDIELFDCVDISQYIVPIFHCEIGLGNYMI